MAGEFCTVDTDCPEWEVCVDGVCQSMEGMQRCHGYDLEEYQTGGWVTIEENSPSCGFSEEVLKDAYYYDLYNRGWMAAAAEYLSRITTDMSLTQRYPIYLEIYYKYAGGGETPPPAAEPFPWTAVAIAVGGVAIVATIMIVSRKKVRAKKGGK
jgi:hypothetical protein